MSQTHTGCLASAYCQNYPKKNASYSSPLKLPPVKGLTQASLVQALRTRHSQCPGHLPGASSAPQQEGHRHLLPLVKVTRVVAGCAPGHSLLSCLWSPLKVSVPKRASGTAPVLSLTLWYEFESPSSNKNKQHLVRVHYVPSMYSRPHMSPLK